MLFTEFPLNRSYKKPKKIKRNILTSLLIFFFINLFMGFNLGFKKYLKKQVRPWTTLIQVLVVVIVVGVLLAPQSNSFYDVLDIIAAPQYLLYVLILQFSKYNLFDLILDIHDIDKNIMQPVERKLGIIVTLWSPIFGIIKSIVCVWYCIFIAIVCYNFILPGYLKCIFTQVVDGTVIILVCMNFYIYRSLKYLKKYLETSKVDLEFVTNYYISMIDCYDNIMPLYGKLIFVEIIATVPNLLQMLWRLTVTVKDFANENGWIFVGQSLFIAHAIINFCCPAIVAEMCNSQMEEIKRILHDMRTSEEYEEKQTEVLHLLHYIEARQLQYRVCRVLPTDLRLVVSLFSFCITYFIVILQFTHLV